MIEFKALAMNTDIDELHAIFLLKKNIQPDIIKMILRYLPIVAPETLKVTSVGQEYESTKEQNDYKTKTGMTYK